MGKLAGGVVGEAEHVSVPVSWVIRLYAGAWRAKSTMIVLWKFSLRCTTIGHTIEEIVRAAAAEMSIVTDDYEGICLPPHSVAWDSDDGGSLRHSNC